jgi:hypothetical protein
MKTRILVVLAMNTAMSVAQPMNATIMNLTQAEPSTVKTITDGTKMRLATSNGWSCDVTINKIGATEGDPIYYGDQISLKSSTGYWSYASRDRWIRMNVSSVSAKETFTIKSATNALGKVNSALAIQLLCNFSTPLNVRVWRGITTPEAPALTAVSAYNGGGTNEVNFSISNVDTP